MNTTTIGFIGTGVMGTGMIRNLKKPASRSTFIRVRKARPMPSLPKAASGLTRRLPSLLRRTSSFPSSAIRKTWKKSILAIMAS